ncbi:MAG: S-methyl-5-thioribose-1-phosphate isomerase [Proteobacteria bacterium]|nr:S-methyl-5-thioribose-1-phosphate isomerase [Pseudomonadota bacterium]
MHAGYRSLVRRPGVHAVEVIDQRRLPHETVTLTLADAGAAAAAIRDMTIRGAPLIGAVGAYGLAMALDHDPGDASLAAAHAMLDKTRPTAVNLRWALDRVRAAVRALPVSVRAHAAWREADAIVAEDIAINQAIGVHGLGLLRELAAARELAATRGRAATRVDAVAPARPLNVMTHCNAGALATCGFGTATAPLFLAQSEGLPLHVWVSETRPRLQGANLTAWELAQHGIAHAVFVDSAAGLLMRRGEVDLVLVGADRVAANGDVCNKIGTYDKALAAADNDVPFYVALPSPTFDGSLGSGDMIAIEARAASEVLEVTGRGSDDTTAGATVTVGIAPAGTRAVNFAFDVTPARLVTGYITERGIAKGAGALAALFGRSGGEERGEASGTQRGRGT